jgi:hypothetical protein
MTLHKWWIHTTGASTANRKAIVSIVLLTFWEVWNERNARVFGHKHVLPTVIFGNIKKDLRHCVAVGAKRVSDLMLRE